MRAHYAQQIKQPSRESTQGASLLQRESISGLVHYDPVNLSRLHPAGINRQMVRAVLRAPDFLSASADWVEARVRLRT